MSVAAVPITGGGDAPRGPWRRRLLSGLAALAALALLVPFAPMLALLLVGGAIVVWLSLSPKRAFVVLAWLLPLHTITMAFLFGVLGVPAPILRLLAAWKELVVLAVFGATLIRAMTGRGSSVSMHWMDLVVGGLGALILGDLIAREAFSSSTLVPFIGQLYGARDSGVFLVLYFVGRSNAREMTTDGILKMMFVIGVLTAILGILEYFFVPPQMLAAVGLAAYMKDFLNVGVYLTEDDLPQNFFSDIGGIRFRRAGSVWLSSQGFALSFLLIMPAATLLLLRGDRHARLRRLLGYAVSWIGLLLSITRMPIVGIFVGVCIVGWYMHRRWAILGVVATCVGAVALAIALVPNLGAWLVDTLFFKTSSSSGHIGDWTGGVTALFENPMGLGLGTADATGDRFGAAHVTGDNLYLKYGVELGFLGLGLLLTMFAGVAATAWSVARSKIASMESRRFGIWVLAATVGIVIASMTVTLFGDQFVSYLYLWMAGAMVSVAQANRIRSTA